jgi:Nucleotidyl transferase AbiEii toxin, Type IV TA system
MQSLPASTAWSFGGGTRLALRYGHRISYDVDLFVNDAQIIPYLSPRVNDAVAALVGYDVAEDSTSLQIRRPEGFIDIVVAASLTQPGVEPETILGGMVPAQTPEEILAKKMQHRGHAFTHRDCFDLAMLLERDPTRVAAAEAACSDFKLMLLRQRLDLLLPVLSAELPDYVNPTAFGAHLLTEAAPRIRAWLDS